MNKHIKERRNAMGEYTKELLEYRKNSTGTKCFVVAEKLPDGSGRVICTAWGEDDVSEAHASRMTDCWNAMAGIDDPVGTMAEIEDVLTRLADYMDRHSDVVDGDYGEPEANKEMLLLSAIEPLLSRMGGGE